jgi:hypothetical protein
MIHGLDTSFLVAAEVSEHADHASARATIAKLIAVHMRNALTLSSLNARDATSANRTNSITSGWEALDIWHSPSKPLEGSSRILHIHREKMAWLVSIRLRCCPSA